MYNILAQSKDYVKNLYGVKLVAFISFVFVFFLLLGLAMGYIFMPVNKNSEQNTAVAPVVQEIPFYEGRIDYVDARLYPGKDVSHVLTSSSGEILYLLTANDSILKVSEGQYAKVYGSVEPKTQSDKYDLLKVSKVVISSTQQ